jgi:hypothetical protein
MDYERLRRALDEEIRRWLPVCHSQQTVDQLSITANVYTKVGPSSLHELRSRGTLVGWYCSYTLLRNGGTHAAGFTTAQWILDRIRNGDRFVDYRVATFPSRNYIQLFEVYMLKS